MALAGTHRRNLPTSISAVKARNRACGQHFFDADTLRFFGSRIGSRVFVGSNATYFVTSEQMPRSDDPRRYTVRKIKGCDVSTVGKFQQYKTEAAANKAAARVAKTGRFLSPK